MPSTTRVLVPLIVAIATAAHGQTTVAPEDFEALSEGRTLTFSRGGAFFGAEQYFERRRSLWLAGDGTCLEGRWYAEGEQICFLYTNDPRPHCWLFREHGGRYSAHLVEGGVETGLALHLSVISDGPLACPGPDVGS
jgi:hypothetical protein